MCLLEVSKLIVLPQDTIRIRFFLRKLIISESTQLSDNNYKLTYMPQIPLDSFGA